MFSFKFNHGQHVILLKKDRFHDEIIQKHRLIKWKISVCANAVDRHSLNSSSFFPFSPSDRMLKTVACLIYATRSRVEVRQDEYLAL